MLASVVSMLTSRAASPDEVVERGAHALHTARVARLAAVAAGSSARSLATSPEGEVEVLP